MRAVAVGIAAAMLTGCAAAPGSAPSATVTVGAAASLTDVMPAIIGAFEAEEPGITVRVTFAGSNALVEQLRAGTPIDVLATASRQAMDGALADALVRDPLPFATNALALVVPPGNPAGLHSLADLPRADLAVCAPDVPCGAAAAELLDRNGIEVEPVTRELDVRAVLGKVMADEVDAGIVYATDARAAGTKVATIAIPADANLVTTSVVAVAGDPPADGPAAAFARFLVSETAQRILRDAGFGPAP